MTSQQLSAAENGKWGVSLRAALALPAPWAENGGGVQAGRWRRAVSMAPGWS